MKFTDKKADDTQYLHQKSFDITRYNFMIFSTNLMHHQLSERQNLYRTQVIK